MSDQTEMKQLVESAKRAEAAIDEKLNDAALETRIKGVADPLIEQTVKAASDEFTKSYADWEEKFNKAENERKGLEAKLNRLMASSQNPDSPVLSEVALEQRQKFYKGFMGRGQVDEYRNFIDSHDELKALTVADDAQAGYMLSPATLEAEVARVITETSPIRQFASVRNTTSLTYERRVNAGGGAAVWEDNELDAATENTAQNYKKVKFDAHALRALYVVGPNMLDDAAVSIENEFAQEMAIQFAVSENNAYLLGDGTTQPRGILTYTNTASGSYDGTWEQVEYYATGVSGGFAASTPDDTFIDMIHSMKAGYNGRFFMRRQTLGETRKLRDADDRSLFQWDGTMPGNIAGEAFTIFQDMPAIAANSFSIMYADLNRAYQITDREGMSVMRDPYSSKPSVEFLGRKRIGGAVKMFEAVKLMKFGTS